MIEIGSRVSVEEHVNRTSDETRKVYGVVLNVVGEQAYVEFTYADGTTIRRVKFLAALTSEV